MAKKKINEEVREPQSDVNRNLTSSVNKYLDQYMTRVGWTNEDQRDRFIEIMTKFIVTGKDVNRQRLINNYLDKGLQVLNLEINKGKMKVDNSEDTELDSENINEIILQGRTLKRKLNEGAKNLIDKNYSLDEAKSTAIFYLKENKKISSLKNLSSINEQESNSEQEDVYLTNFKTFFKLYLTREYSWTTETVNTIIDKIISIVDKASGNSNMQDNVDKKINDLIKQVSSVMNLSELPNDAKNLDVSRSEFKKYAVSTKGWVGKTFSSFFSSILKLLVNSKNVNIQRIITKKISDIEGSLPSEKKKEKKSKEENNNKKAEEES